jgi:hypothetical protein
MVSAIEEDGKKAKYQLETHTMAIMKAIEAWR